MFDPSRDQARLFFIEAWTKHLATDTLTPLEQIAARLIEMHSEYQVLFQDPDAIARDFRPEDGQVNPFLHLSLHLAIEEQLSIDQPPGLRAAFAHCQMRCGNRHDALHLVLDCLGETIFNAQRNRTPPDGAAYVECVMRKATND
ncbi:DUF1841 family protein [Rhodocyclaceae bacterium SMB388]